MDMFKGFLNKLGNKLSPKSSRKKNYEESHGSEGMVIKPPSPSDFPISTQTTKYVNVEPNLNQEMIEGPLTEELQEHSKSVFLSLLKHLRIGMDLSKVPLPTFILEPKSLLEKLSDFMSHGDLLAMVPTIDDPLSRFIQIVKWYLSGFYLKPKGVKKPYNPILGELFRCMWPHQNNSKTFYVSEQVSHHPPISAFYACNRPSGYVINGAVTFRSKFLGTSAGSFLEGVAHVFILPRNEVYEVSFPGAFAKGFIFGPLVMEFTGPIVIQCRQTGFRADIEFKQKGVFGGDYNLISGEISDAQKTPLFYIRGKWDGEIYLSRTSNFSDHVSLLWSPTLENRKTRLPKHKPPMEEMKPNESDRLWQKVCDALRKGDQQIATNEKFALEEEQRQQTKIREQEGLEWKPRLFQKREDGNWWYKWINISPWDPRVESCEIEEDGVIKSLPHSNAPKTETSNPKKPQ